MSLPKKILSYGFWVIYVMIVGIIFSFLLIQGGAAAYSHLTGQAKPPPESQLAPQSRFATSGRGFASAGLGSLYSQELALSWREPSPGALPTPHFNSLTLMFVGDIMLDRGVEQSVQKNFAGDYNQLFENVALLKKADILFGNLEGSVSDKGKDRGKKYSFRMDPIVLPALKAAGFDVVSFANNHVADWGRVAFEDTLLQLRENGILAAGAGFSSSDATIAKVIESNDIMAGYLAFSDVGPNWMKAENDKAGILVADDPHFEEIISQASAEVDLLVVSFHWGDEYKEHNSRQENLARLAIDSGANIVIGHHPHIIQDTEWYKDGLIAYSLGNFIFDQHFSKETMQGMLLEVTIGRNIFSQKVEIWDVNKKIVKLNKLFQPDEIIPLVEDEISTSTARLAEARAKRATLPKEHELFHELSTKVHSSNNPCPKPKEIFPDLILFNMDSEQGIGDYIPQNLVLIKELVDARGEMICLEINAVSFLTEMFADATAAGYQLTVTSGFRDKYWQNNIYNSWRLKTQGGASVFQSVAPPGHSEHQLGTTVDLTTSSIDYQSASVLFGLSSEYKWLEENSYKYGFIQSYPRGKEAITGYTYEPWHYRYVGIENAQKIKESGLTITEFLE